MSKIEDLKQKMLGKDINVSCPCCPSTDKMLSMDTILHNGFGGWTILKDGEYYFSDEVDKDWEDFKRLKEIDKECEKSPESKWEAHLHLPLRELLYERSDCGNWVLTKTGQGFA